MFFLKQTIIIRNLVVMGYMWAACSFGQYLIMIYVKYLPGNIFINTITSNMSQNFAALMGGFIYSKLGIKASFTILFTVSVIGGVLILLFSQSAEQLMPLFVCLAMFGCSGGFTLVYVSTQDVFPAIFCATAIGICNVASRTLTVMSDIVAEIQPPLPMILFTSISFCAIISIQFVKPMKVKEEAKK